MSSLKTIYFNFAPRNISVSTASAEAAAETDHLQSTHEQALAEAHREGFEEAMNFLNQQMLEQRSDLAQLQDTTFLAVVREHASLVEQISALLPGLAIEVAQRILAGIEPDPKIVASFCAETLAEIAPDSPGVEIWLCPRDFKLVSDLEAEFSQKYPGLRIHSDPELQPGDCRAHSRFGEIDGRLSTKLANVARSLV